MTVTMLRNFLRTPSSFPDDPRGFAFNQAGHAAWEVIQWRRFGGQDWDGLQDWAFVVVGAFAAANLWLLVPMAGYLGAGYLRRLDQ